MNKAKALLLLSPFLFAACHCGKHAASPQLPPKPYSALNARESKPAPAVPSATKDAYAAFGAAPQTQNGAKNASVSASSGAQQTARPEANEKAVVSAPKTAAVGPNNIEQTAPYAPKSAAFSAAPDKAAFEDEPLIDFNGRLLHPYASLTPDPLAAQTAPWAYEQLKYGVYYSFIKAGTAYIRNRGLVSVNGRPAYLLQTTAFSASVIDAFFKVRDVNQSWLDAEHFYSLGYGQSVREGSYKRDEWVNFDYTAKKYSGQMQKKEAPRPVQGPLDMKILDMLTSLYYVRAQKLEPGKDIIFDIVNREKQYPLIVKVIKKETVKVHAGTFKCILVEPQIRGEGIFVSKGKSLKVWLTDDEYKIPVKMKTEVFIGSVSAELLEYKRQEPLNIL